MLQPVFNASYRVPVLRRLYDELSVRFASGLRVDTPFLPSERSQPLRAFHAPPPILLSARVAPARLAPLHTREPFTVQVALPVDMERLFFHRSVRALHTIVRRARIVHEVPLTAHARPAVRRGDVRERAPFAHTLSIPLRHTAARTPFTADCLSVPHVAGRACLAHAVAILERS